MIKEKKTICVDNTQIDTRYIASTGNERLRSFLGIPLIVKETAIGLITLDSYQIARYTKQDEELGLAIANHASIAIENARLFDVEQRRRKQAEALRKATEALTTSIEMDRVFEIIFDLLIELVPYDSASIETVSGETSRSSRGAGSQKNYWAKIIRPNLKNGEVVTKYANPSLFQMSSRQPF